MKKFGRLPCVLAVAVVLAGCSSRPREFVPTVAAAPDSPATGTASDASAAVASSEAPVSTAALDAAYAECSQLLVAGKLDSDGRLASGAGGVATGAGVAAAGGAAAAATAGYAGLAVAAATVVLLPFAIVGGAWGMSRMKRAEKEKAIKAALSGCLRERGYEVTGWVKTGRKLRTSPPKP